MRAVRGLLSVVCSGRLFFLFQGVVTAAVSLIHALAQHAPNECRGCVSLAVSRLSRIVTSTYTDLLVRFHVISACLRHLSASVNLVDFAGIVS